MRTCQILETFIDESVCLHDLKILFRFNVEGTNLNCIFDRTVIRF